uniref:Retrovirus-related Pol polyprotein from transposon TNT 1-94 n=1 Tax=Tanacetum cinerariifolium TaxID=118510 RepID=A0A6L2KKG6_TANCI|nr:retrovirus-related Pol polyprotein from transposon TNT 1-94 [Tanacetum cinerariifolium]
MDSMSMDDLYNNLKVYESVVKGMSNSSLSKQNMAFVSSSNNNSNNEAANTAHGVSFASTQVNTSNIGSLSDVVICAFLASQPNSPQIAHEDLQQIYPDDLEEMDLRWQMAMLTMRARRLGGYYWSDQAEKGPNYALMTLSSESVEERIEFFKTNESTYLQDILGLNFEIHCNEITIRELRKKLDIVQKEKDSIQLNVDKLKNASKSLNKLIDSQIVDNCEKGLGYKSYNAVPPPHTRKFMPPKLDLSFTGLEEFASEPIVEKSKAMFSEDEPVAKSSAKELKEPVRKNTDVTIIEEWVSDDEEENVIQPKVENKTVKPSVVKKEYVKPKNARKIVKPFESHSQNTHTKRGNQRNWNNMMSQRLGSNIEMFNQACYVCGSFDHLQANCTYHQKHFKNQRMIMKRLMEDMLLFEGTPKEGKSQAKANEGFFVRYSLNSKAFRVFNSRTRIVEENLHIRFSENTPNVVRSGPDWLFDIDALTRTINYEPIVVGTQSNGFAGTKVNDNASQASKKKVPEKYYILLPLWTADPSFSQDPKSFHDDGFKPSCDDEKKVDEDPRKESECNDQETKDSVNITNKVNTVSSTINVACTNEVNVFDDGAEADMNDLDITIQVSPISTTRIHKDHHLDQVIGDVQSAIQTRKMNKLDKRGIMIRNKVRLVAQGYTQEEGIDYDEVFAPIARIEAIRLFLAYTSFKDFVVYQMDVKGTFFYGKIEEEVYVCQPPRFEDPYFPDKLYKVEKAIYRLHQAPRAWEVQIHAKVDGKDIIITESSVRRDLQLVDEDGIDCLLNSTIFEQLTLMGNLDSFGKFLMYPRFVQTFLDIQLDELPTHKKIYVSPSHTKKFFDNMKRIGKGFSGRVTPLFPTMVVQNQAEMGKDEVVYNELDDRLVRAATTASRLEAELDSGNIDKTQSKATPNEPSFPATSSGGGPRCQEAMRDTPTQTRVLDLENELKMTKTAHKTDVDGLKERVKKLEKKHKSRTHKLKRLYKVGLTAKVEESSNDNADLGENASKQGRIESIDADEDIILVRAHEDNASVYRDDENIVEEVVEDIITVKLILDVV